MLCKEVKAKAYQTRKSPAYHAGQCKGQTKKGKDGTYISKADSRGVFKWVRKTSKQKQQKTNKTPVRYEIHMNGGRPFIVEVADGHMTVFLTQDVDGQLMSAKQVFSTPFKQLWVPTGAGPEHAEGDPREVGNTLLAYIKDNQYIHVGDGILRILIKEPVRGYYSELINNDVPEPYIYTDENVYIINDLRFYPKTILLDQTKGIFSPANEGLDERKQGQGTKMDFKRIRIPRQLIKRINAGLRRDMEELVQGIAFDRARTYRVVARSNPVKMLKWVEPYEIQALAIGAGHRFQRVGAIGDGNCLLHSFLFATSPTYRSHEDSMRKYIALEFRAQLAANEDELNTLAADYYGEDRGGALIIEESMQDLTTETHAELGVEFVPILGKLFNYNILAVQKNADGMVRPVRNTFLQYDETNPTIVINYVGSGIDFGHAEYQKDGHYEPVVWSEADVLGATSSSEKMTKSKRMTKKKARAAKLVELPGSTIYEFASGAPELETLLALFRTPSESRGEYKHAAALEVAARERERMLSVSKKSSPVVIGTTSSKSSPVVIGTTSSKKA